jgi:hypothetical protein
MIARAGSGWQTTLADLSLILFMVTVAALSQAGDGADGAARASPQGAPLAVYRPGKGAPPLATWLLDQPRDARQLLTIISTYRPGGEAQALTLALALAQQASAADMAARVIIEPGDGGASAALAYDQPDAPLAQGLHEEHIKPEHIKLAAQR